MTYVDGYVLAVPTAHKDAYVRLAELASVVFKDHGALSVVENWGDTCRREQRPRFRWR